TQLLETLEPGANDIRGRPALLAAQLDGSVDIAGVKALADVVQERRERSSPLGLFEAPQALDDERGLQDDEHDQSRDQRPTLVHLLTAVTQHGKETPDAE